MEIKCFTVNLVSKAQIATQIKSAKSSKLEFSKKPGSCQQYIPPCRYYSLITESLFLLGRLRSPQKLQSTTTPFSPT